MPPSAEVNSAPNWPKNRSHPRYRLEAAMHAVCDGHGVVRGWCRDFGEGGLCGTFPLALELGEQIELHIPLPASVDPLKVRACVRYVNGKRYGFEFQHVSNLQRAQIRRYGRDLITTAYLLTPEPTVARTVQRLLQQMEVAQVHLGCPKVLPVPNPHVAVVDGDWPDYLEVIRFFRAEAEDTRAVIVAVLAPEVPVKEVHEAGADLVLHKPVSVAWAQRILGTACRLLHRSPRPSPAAAMDSALMRVLGMKLNDSV